MKRLFVMNTVVAVIVVPWSVTICIENNTWARGEMDFSRRVLNSQECSVASIFKNAVSQAS